jgi:hypothetical protein
MTEIIFVEPPFSRVSGEITIRVLNSRAELSPKADVRSPSFTPCASDTVAITSHQIHPVSDAT